MNAVERAVVLSRAEYLDAGDLALMMADSPLATEKQTTMLGNLPLEEVEKRTVLEALEAACGNKSEAARRLGITRKTLRNKLEKYQRGN
jgi:two-component system response regulator HydG